MRAAWYARSRAHCSSATIFARAASSAQAASGTVASGSPSFLYALPVGPSSGKAVASKEEWDDYALWVGTFAARGAGCWEETDKREVEEYGLEFRQASAGGRVLRRFDEPTRSAFHNKVRLFSRLTAAKVECVPPTLFTPADARRAMAASPPGTVWFYKKAKASRGQGVFPITSLEQLPEEELQAAEAAAADAAAAITSGDTSDAAGPAATAAGRGGVAAATGAAAGERDAATAAAGGGAGGRVGGGGGGVFQQCVPGMALWNGSHKYDLRVLVVMGPGRRAWLHRTLYMRIATSPLVQAPPSPGAAAAAASGGSTSTSNTSGSSGGAGFSGTGAPKQQQDMSRAAQCTNISQGGAVIAVHGNAELPGYDTVLSHICAATHSVVSAMYDVLPYDGAIHYFGFDYMLDEQRKPWLLEVNSTPRLVNCNRTGAVHEALVELLCTVVEPYLTDKPIRVGSTGGWIQVLP